MERATAEDIYYTMCGELVEGARVPGIEDEFAAGAFCEQCYERLSQACYRLYDRLGVDSDEDVERILVEGAQITEHLCLKMYAYGKKCK